MTTNQQKKVVAFAASSSRQSINKSLATYAASLIEDAEVEILDLNDFELPLFSEDREQSLGQPQLAKDFLAKLASADLLIVSFSEHNGNYSAAYKNLFDWCSRITRKIYADKAMLCLSTSPGAGGGGRVLKIATDSVARFGADIRGSLSVPEFNAHFDSDSGKLTDPELNQQLGSLVTQLQA